jgi:hypothetical protein
VVVERKPTTWQRLNQRFSIWQATGRGAAVGNIKPLFQWKTNAAVVQLARALRDVFLPSWVQFPNVALFFF